MVYRCSMLIYEFRRLFRNISLIFNGWNRTCQVLTYIPNGTCESGPRLAPLVRPHIIPPIGTASIVSRGQGQDPRNMMSAVVDLPRKTGRHTIKCHAAKESMTAVDVKRDGVSWTKGRNYAVSLPQLIPKPYQQASTTKDLSFDQPLPNRIIQLQSFSIHASLHTNPTLLTSPRTTI